MRRARLEAPVALLGLFCFKDGDLRAYAGEGRVNTDDNALIEFALPFDLFTNRVSELHASLRRASRGLPSLVAFPEGITPESRAADWENWGISFETSRRMELSREAREEAKRLR
jgi:hypothetical protein